MLNNEYSTILNKSEQLHFRSDIYMSQLKSNIYLIPLFVGPTIFFVLDSFSPMYMRLPGDGEVYHGL